MCLFQRIRDESAVVIAGGSSPAVESSLATDVEVALLVTPHPDGDSHVTNVGKPLRRRSVFSTTISTSTMGRERLPVHTVTIVHRTRPNFQFTCEHTPRCDPTCVASAVHPSSSAPRTAPMLRDIPTQETMCAASATRPSRWPPNCGSTAASMAWSAPSSARCAL